MNRLRSPIAPKAPLNTGEEIKTILAKLQGVMKGSQVSISVEEVKFQRGQQLIDWLAEVGRQLQPGEVRQ
jgi:hypothetical protein